MVSLGMIFKRYKYFFLLASLFVLGGTAQSFAAADFNDTSWKCMSDKTKCCVNGAKSCCEDNGTLYDTWSCDENSCGEPGHKEYKYTADRTCGYTTSTRTCCSNGSWSGWDKSCSVALLKECPEASKPNKTMVCPGGTQKRDVGCNHLTGEWEKGSWGDCDCSDPAYETVYMTGGTSCCQKKDGTGVRCRTDETSDPSWSLFCNNCCNGGSDTAVSSLSACGPCTKSEANQYPSYQCCVKSGSTINGYVCGH